MSVRAKKVLTDKQLHRALDKLPDWKTNKNQSYIKASFAQPDYITGLVFIARIAVHAELLQHHPDIQYSYNAVTVKLSTHDVSGITSLDVALATRISNLTT